MKLKSDKWLTFTAVAVCGCLSEAGASSDERLLRDLVRIPSVSADVAAVNRAVDFARADFERRGLFCTVVTNAQGRKMLCDGRGSGTSSGVVVVGFSCA